ncbi:multidrug transporter MATE [Streptococcus sp. HMSC074B11]|uniref:multidrug transporter MATE n=1 Tax=Streptococcus sp. HMSC074B11 TaxID=1715098 RepID=UPI0008A2CD0F|nr:multidrug transporter MATE [Streptococcus sp. HMSC074B11]OFN98197.1 multidrug transporter MATE [Streptococcus sp. HMSC074B11]
MYQILNAIAHGVVGTVLIAIWFVPLAFLMLLKSVWPKSKVSFIWKGYKKHEKN